mmetsp:Transcript_41309/g.104144  ORF Transcript_41309/g.104144 Transcript_41309/m.104144 type:complete len:221 (-) Transcript_41309:2972-3634(-)
MLCLLCYPPAILLSSSPDDLEVQRELARLRQQHSSSVAAESSAKMVRNQRYRYLTEVLRKSDFFEEREMRRRSPALWALYVGRYQSPGMQAPHTAAAGKLYEQILENYDMAEAHRREEAQGATKKWIYENDTTEKQTTDEYNVEEHLVCVSSEGETKAENEARGEVDEQDRIRSLILVMEQRFLNGEETEFDYSEVDGNESYTDWKLVDQDTEDDYFADA